MFKPLGLFCCFAGLGSLATGFEERLVACVKARSAPFDPSIGLAQSQPAPDQIAVVTARRPFFGGFFKLELKAQVGARLADPAAKGRPGADERLVRNFNRFFAARTVAPSGE